MLVSTEGLVLRQIPFSDTSLIVKILTRDYGLESFLIKGAKSKKNPKAPLYKPINFLAISFYQRENKALKQIKEAQLLFAPDAQNFGIYKSAISMFVVELLNHTIPENSASDSEKYDFITYSIAYLRDHPLNPHFYLSFIYQYSIYLGIEIPLTSFNTPLEHLTDYATLDHLSLTKKERNVLFHQFEEHYLENLTNYKALKSIDILNEILN
jgi:DNA repair protein RecO (recombination protein O)